MAKAVKGWGKGEAPPEGGEPVVDETKPVEPAVEPEKEPEKEPEPVKPTGPPAPEPTPAGAHFKLTPKDGRPDHVFVSFAETLEDAIRELNTSRGTSFCRSQLTVEVL